MALTCVRRSNGALISHVTAPPRFLADNPHDARHSSDPIALLSSPEFYQEYPYESHFARVFSAPVFTLL